MDVLAAVIQPQWTLVFCKNRGPWWVRLLACGRYHHVKAIAYLPTMRAWLFYDVKFNLTRLMLAREDDPEVEAFLLDYLHNSDTIAMPRLPTPKRAAPQVGFWCTLAMKHLVGIHSGALRPDRLWRDCIAAGGKPHLTTTASDARDPAARDSAARMHLEAIRQPDCLGNSSLSVCQCTLVRTLWARIRALHGSVRIDRPLLGGHRPLARRCFACGATPSA